MKVRNHVREFGFGDAAPELGVGDIKLSHGARGWVTVMYANISLSFDVKTSIKLNGARVSIFASIDVHKYKYLNFLSPRN